MAYKIKNKKIPYKKYEERMAFIDGFYEGRKSENEEECSRKKGKKISYRLK